MDTSHQLSERLRLTLELVDLGFEMKAASLRRQFPSDSEERLATRLAEWTGDRPGDADGIPVPWPRKSR